MFQQALHILIISGICFLWGAPVLLLLHTDSPTERRWYASWRTFLPFLFFCGCLLLSLLTSWLQLLLPMRFSSLLWVTAIQTAATFLLGRRKLSRLLPAAAPQRTPLRGSRLVFLIAGVILLLLLSCLITSSRDTRIYHLQIVSWTLSYPTVPGIANLFPRFGLGSNWFTLIALFHIPAFGAGSFTYLNVTMDIWFFIWLFSRWEENWRKPTVAGRALCFFYFLVMAYAFLDWELLRDTANSTDYDTIVTVCFFLCIDFLIQGLAQPSGETGFSRLFIMIALAAIGFKLSGLFILILVAWYAFSRLTRQNALYTAAAGILFILPVLIRNYLTTGYPLFPLSIQLGHPQWQLPLGMTNLLHNYITLTNRFYNQAFQNSYAFATEHSHWIGAWVHGILWQQKLIMTLTLTSLSLFLFKPPTPLDPRRFRTLLSLLLLITLCWFFTAPSPRFGYGVLLFTAFLPLAFLIGPLISPAWYRYGLMLGALSIFIYFPGKLRQFLQTPTCWLRPQPFAETPYSRDTIRNVVYLLPDRTDSANRMIGFLELPAIGDTNSYLAPIGPSIRYGFRFFNSPDSTFIANYNY